MLAAVSAQPQLDRCPGLLRPHRAEDGALVRLRVPGGRIAVALLRQVLAAARADGADSVQLTSRANLQVRALPDPLPERFVERIEATGLLPSASHERVRNIVASPLAPELAPLVAALDAGLVADPDLAALSGRFLFGLADASGSVLTEPYDVAWQSTGGDDGMLLAAGRGVAVPRERAVAALLALAREFLVCRGSASVWNLRDLPADAGLLTGMAAYAPRVAPPLVPGPVGDDLVAGVPLGFLTSAHVEAMADVADTVVVTPWRSIVVPGAAAAADDLAAAGLVTQRNSPWSRLSACIGAPACAHSRSATVRVAREVAESGRRLPEGLRVHMGGSARGGGVPPTDVVAVPPADAAEVLALATEVSR